MQADTACECRTGHRQRGGQGQQQRCWCACTPAASAEQVPDGYPHHAFPGAGCVRTNLDVVGPHGRRAAALGYEARHGVGGHHAAARGGEGQRDEARELGRRQRPVNDEPVHLRPVCKCSQSQRRCPATSTILRPCTCCCLCGQGTPTLFMPANTEAVPPVVLGAAYVHVPGAGGSPPTVQCTAIVEHTWDTR